jgi:hypothetical protein
MQRRRGLVLLAIQLVLVLNVAGKYVYERKVCPRVWTRTVQVDPSLPFRGRYLALQIAVDACALPRSESNLTTVPPSDQGWWSWRVRPEAKDGRLVGVLAGDDVRPELSEELRQSKNLPCDRANFLESADYFIGDSAKSPLPLKGNEELWVEVTVPPAGPPRAVQLAISSDAGFKPLVIR